MHWKNIQKTRELPRLLRRIWAYEQTLPEFFKHSSWLWTPTFKSFKRWARDCGEIWGLFDGETFIACVYIERQDVPHIAVVHFGVAEKTSVPVLAAEFKKLRDQLFHRGVKVIRGWVLRKNFAFVRLMSATGFEASGLELAHGEAHGQVLKWDLLQARAV